MYTHAVLSQQGKGDYYMIHMDKEDISGYAPSLEQLHERMEDKHIQVLWVMPGCAFSQQIRRSHFEELDPQQYTVFLPEQRNKNKPPHGAMIRFNRYNAYERFIMFPEHREWKVPQNKDKGIWHADNPQDLLTTVQYLQEEYQTNIVWSPAYVGMDRLREINFMDQRTIQSLPQEQEQRWNEIAKQCVNYLAWATRQPITGKYAIGYDKNAQYLGAAQSVKLGNGAFMRCTKLINECEQFPGFWEYKLVEWNRNDFPCPLEKKEGYAHIDLIKAAHQLGAKLDVYQGIVWQEHDKYLAQWSKEMWERRHKLDLEARYQASPAHVNAASTAKMIPNTMVGLFAKTGFPHWNISIVHRAIANQVYTLNKLYRDFGIKPILVSKDSFYIATDKDSVYAIPGFLDNRDKQCGYKPIGMCEMNSTIQAAFERADDRRFGTAGVEGVIRKEMRG